LSLVLPRPLPIHRLAEWANGKLAAHVPGNHIERTRTPYLEYPIGKLSQPDEHELEMSVGHILELDRALSHMTGLARVALRDMTICRSTQRFSNRCGRRGISRRRRITRSCIRDPNGQHVNYETNPARDRSLED
jgi:hypothetical protein